MHITFYTCVLQYSIPDPTKTVGYHSGNSYDYNITSAQFEFEAASTDTSVEVKRFLMKGCMHYGGKIVYVPFNVAV